MGNYADSCCVASFKFAGPLPLRGSTRLLRGQGDEQLAFRAPVIVPHA